MKLVSKSLILISISLSLVLFSQCKKDPCKDVTCFNNGTKMTVGDNCECDCPAGFTGELCETVVPSDPCEGVDCGPNAVCNQGICECKPGFSGPNCSIEDKCVTQSIDCGPNGNCQDGICICDEGYEGDNCEIESRAKFIGAYLVNDDCDMSGTANYSASISNAANINEINLDNFWDIFINPVLATVRNDSLLIELQEPDEDDFTVEGTGVFQGSSITINFVVTDKQGGGMDVCSSVWTK